MLANCLWKYLLVSSDTTHSSGSIPLINMAQVMPPDARFVPEDPGVLGARNVWRNERAPCRWLCSLLSGLFCRWLCCDSSIQEPRRGRAWARSCHFLVSEVSVSWTLFLLWVLELFSSLALFVYDELSSPFWGEFVSIICTYVASVCLRFWDVIFLIIC